MQAIWISWEKQRRNRSMAACVGATLHELEYKGNRIARYLVLAVKTYLISRRSNADVIFYQNPSIVLSALLAALKSLSLVRAKIVGDFHNAGVYPPVAGFLLPWIVRTSNLIIVSNKNLETAITSIGGKCLSVPDPIPHMDHATSNDSHNDNSFEVFFVCSWADDEPIAHVLQAADIVGRSQLKIRISITGRPKLQAVGWQQAVPQNVLLTGFLTEQEFEHSLAQSDVVLDLTTRSDCMVCGAYEATSAEVPMILSDNEPTKAYFSKGALYTDNSAEDIARLILQAHEQHQRLKTEVTELKKELLQSEKELIQNLCAALA